MSAQLELKPTIEVEGFGTYDNIESYRINADYLTPTDEWEVTVYDQKDPARLRSIFRPLRPIKLYLGDALQLVGRIDGCEGTGNGQRSLRVYGRDYLADLVDAGIDPALRVKKNESLGGAILQAFAPFGIDVSVGNFDAMRNAVTGKNPYTGAEAGAGFRDVDETKRRTASGRSRGKRGTSRNIPDLTIEDTKPNTGQGAFEWGSALAARHGATLQPSTKRNEICLCEPEYGQDALYQFLRVDGGACNIESGVARRDWSDLPTVIIPSGRAVASGTKAAGLSLDIPTFGPDSPSNLYENTEIQAIITGPNGGPAIIDAVVGKKSPPRSSYDSTAPCYRPMFYEDRQSKNRDQMERGLRRMLCERVRKTLVYYVELQGICDRNTGAIYGLDTIGHVRDEIEDVDEDLWVFSRTLEQPQGRGPVARLQLIRPGSFVL